MICQVTVHPLNHCGEKKTCVKDNFTDFKSDVSDHKGL